MVFILLSPGRTVVLGPSRKHPSTPSFPDLTAPQLDPLCLVLFLLFLALGPFPAPHPPPAWLLTWCDLQRVASLLWKPCEYLYDERVKFDQQPPTPSAGFRNKQTNKYTNRLKHVVYILNTTSKYSSLSHRNLLAFIFC